MADRAETETGPNGPGVSPYGQGVPGVSEVPRAEAGAQRRSLLVPALIGGVFVFAAVGFSTRSADMNRGFARMDERFAQTDARFTEINGILLDHTDRLARLEAAQNAHTHP
ncbi:hypothetical protein [Candidatus Poriferisodalis sp.]|uniref:hypothetical protein n=1 Tax=Candidatus Poriferisodalis sp. TaxID=3101277 RepID=UPI003B0226F7